MPVWRINDENYAQFIQVFRDLGAGASPLEPDFKAAGERMGVDPYTAKRAWVAGFKTHTKRYQAISEVLPYVAPPPVQSPERLSSGHDDTLPYTTIRDHSASAPGAASRSVDASHTVGVPPTTPTHPYPPVAPPPTPGAEVVPASHVTVIQALDKLAGRQPAVLLRELEVLDVSRNNIVGLSIVMQNIIARLMKDAQAILVPDAQAMTLPNFAAAANEVAKMSTTLVVAASKVMEAQRLLMGMPSQITEHRTQGDSTGAPGDTEEKRRRLGPLLALLSGSQGASTYTGEEGGEVIDVVSTPAHNPGQFVASTGTGGGQRAADLGNGPPKDPLLSVK